ncbi:MAG: phage portal protein family protein, partial [Waterburya sp.]
GKATFRFLPPKDASDDEKNKSLLVEQMFGDMETSLENVISEAMTMIDYGFAPLEKIYRRRTKDSGSLYDDGIIGLRKISLRHQKSISKFIFDNDGEKVLGIKQDISLLSDPYNRYFNIGDNTPVIPRSKFMLFTAGSTKTNPFGTSPLRNVYLPWKYLQAIEELEASGVSKDLQGLPVLSIPAQYMSEDASPAQKQFYLWAQNLVRNIQMNSQAGVVIPTIFDPETRQPLFKMELLSTEGKKNYDTNKIKEYYRTMIFIGLSSDILLQGNTSVGSFALGTLKNSLTGQAVENYLKHIVEVLNNDLIRQIYELNGWDASRRCTLDYEGFEDYDLDTFSKMIQRAAATGMLPKTLDVVNSVLRSIGVDELPATTTQEELDSLLSEKTSKSGQGMATPFEGTRTSIGSGNDNDGNLDNAA